MSPSARRARRRSWAPRSRRSQIGVAAAVCALGGAALVVPGLGATAAAPADQPLGRDGLLAQYFPTQDLTGEPVTRTEPVDVHPGDGAPVDGIGADHFSVRWTGTLDVRRTGRHLFTTRSDDGIRLWVDDELVIDDWTLHPPRQDHASVGLTAGRPARLRVEFFENDGGALAQLLLRDPRQRESHVVPASRLHPPAAAAAPSPAPTASATPSPSTPDTPSPSASDAPPPAQPAEPAPAQPSEPAPTTSTPGGAGEMPATRDVLQWPYAPDSIWNMPIGSDARYVDAHIGSRTFGVDTDWFIVTSASDPQVTTYAPGGTWAGGRCTGTNPQQQAQWHPEAARPQHVPFDLVIPDAINSGGIYSTPNNSSAFLQPDGKTLVSYNVTTRCEKGAPLYGNWFGESSIYGDGIAGGHGGSAMSSIGGSLRTGELLGDAPIRHALKIDIWGDYLFYDAATGGKRWPAILADGGAPQQYKGKNPALRMGSLLALAPGATAEGLGLTTPVGRKLFAALRDYGAYVVDDSGHDNTYLCVEQRAQSEYEKATGHALDKDDALEADMGRMLAAAKVVDNNAPDSIGGGGTPRAPLAPPFAGS